MMYVNKASAQRLAPTAVLSTVNSPSQRFQHDY